MGFSFDEHDIGDTFKGIMMPNRDASQPLFNDNYLAYPTIDSPTRKSMEEMSSSFLNMRENLRKNRITQDVEIELYPLDELNGRLLIETKVKYNWTFISFVIFFHHTAVSRILFRMVNYIIFFLKNYVN